MKFNQDINGLRGVAILAVLLFHFRVPGFGGGFVGVDIFFVISGFLLSDIILGKLQAGSFSLLGFFMHRVRRIVPALYVMLACCLLLGWWWLAPADYKELGKETAYASLFITNHLFVRDSGYFATEAASKLLLHTWTLGVEWQFYLLLPLLLAGIWRFGVRHLKSLILLLALISLGLSIFGAIWRPEATFFLLPSRAWEFLLGTLLVLHRQRIEQARLGRWPAGCGFILLLACIGLFDERLAYPGYWALLPTLATTLILMAPGGLPSRLLATAPLQWLGTLSYSLYLWHWPLYVACGYYLNGRPTASFAGLFILASLLMGWLSYRWVELPIRQNTHWWNYRRLGVLACCGCLLLYPAGRWLQSSHGAANAYRLSASVLAYAQGSEDKPKETARCHFGAEHPFQDAQQFCRYPGAPEQPPLFLWGDSHADALQAAVQQLAQARQMPLTVATFSACPPLLRGAVASQEPELCRTGNQAALAQLRATPGATVLLVARWSAYLQGRNESHEQDNDFLWSPDGSTRAGTMSTPRRIADFRQALLDTSCALRDAGVKVLLLGPIPEVGVSVPSALARKSMYGSQQETRVSRADYQRRNQTALQLLTEAEAQCGARLIEPATQLCPGDYCQIEQEGRSLYYDDDHLSGRGARLLLPLLEQALTAPR